MFKIYCNTTTTTTKECGGLQVKAAWCCGLRLCLAAPSWRRPVSTPKTFGWSAAVPPMAWYGMVCCASHHQIHQLRPASKTGTGLGAQQGCWALAIASHVHCTLTYHWHQCTLLIQILPIHFFLLFSCHWSEEEETVEDNWVRSHRVAALEKDIQPTITLGRSTFTIYHRLQYGVDRLNIGLHNCFFSALCIVQL